MPPGTRFEAVINGAPRSMCCAGCAAVAQAIAEGGLAAYYRDRTAPASREAAGTARDGRDHAVYDLPEVQQPFVRRLDGGARQATLLVEGITCGACVWLIERGLQRLQGVRSVIVNLAARRLHVAWDDERVKLSGILASLERLGYRAQGFDSAAGESAQARERRATAWRLFVAGLAMMQVMMYAAPAYFAADGMTRDAEQLMRWASLVLTLPVMLWSAAPLFHGSWRELRARRIGMDVPVALALAVAFAASAWATASGRGEVYFDSIAMFVFLLLGARYLESGARARAAESQRRLAARAPAVADRLVPDSQPPATERVAAARLAPGDRALVAPGALVPADGRIVAGVTTMDESLLTGESRPVAKRAGDAVIGGSINLGHPVTVEVVRAGAETVLAGIVRLMDRAQAQRPRIALAADRVARWFTATLLATAAATAAVWWWVEPARALSVMVAVLVVSCPCALSLATPAALTAATTALHRLGMLVTRGHALEALAQATHVVFDKTGTLTSGRLSLIGVIPLGTAEREDCIALAAALEQGSAHPVAHPVRYAAAGFALPPVTEIRNHAGRGVEARLDGKRVRIGTAEFAGELAGLPPPAELAFTADDVVVVVLADEKGYRALLTFGDAPRAGARAVVRALQEQGRTVCLLSGDRGVTALRVARESGIDIAIGDADPAAKLAFVRELQSHGAVVAMVGDGVNDAPVLAQAQVSIAMGGGTDLAHASAGMVLLGDDIGRLPAAFGIARSTMRIIRQNLCWAAGYNAAAIPLAMAGWVTPLAAGIGMAASSLAVVANALRLLGRGGGNPPRPAGGPPLLVLPQP